VFSLQKGKKMRCFQGIAHTPYGTPSNASKIPEVCQEANILLPSSGWRVRGDEECRTQGNCNCSHQLTIEKPQRRAATAKCHEL